jgi:hypothetical protein
MESEKTIQLRTPIELAGQSYTEITLKEPTAAQIASAGEGGGSSAKMDIDLISHVAGLPKAVVGKLGARDFTDCRMFLAGFLRGDQEIGAS